MHDSDLAYYYVYFKCADNARSKQSLLSCLEYELKFIFNNKKAFNAAVYKENVIKAINQVRQQLVSGSLDHLFQ
jgi:hypothetical protein